MLKVITITVNPALDKNSAVDQIIPDKKLRCDAPYYHPGGGGINVSRALKRLCGESESWYLAGGSAGEMMQRLLNEENIQQRVFPIKNWTRENLMVIDKSTTQQYRFGMPGPEMFEEEWSKLLEELKKEDPPPDYLVASGSLPKSVPNDFYARLAKICHERDIKYMVDTSGEPLVKAVGKGVYLMKPNLKELGELTGKTGFTPFEQEEIAKKIIDEGHCEILIISLAARGAMLVTRDTLEYIVPPSVEQKSTVGAGDSMVAGIICKLVENWDIIDTVKYGVAAGTAATMTPGTELCKKEDTDMIYEWMKKRS